MGMHANRVWTKLGVPKVLCSPIYSLRCIHKLCCTAVASSEVDNPIDLDGLLLERYLRLLFPVGGQRYLYVRATVLHPTRNLSMFPFDFQL